MRNVIARFIPTRWKATPPIAATSERKPVNVTALLERFDQALQLAASGEWTRATAHLQNREAIAAAGCALEVRPVSSVRYVEAAPPDMNSVKRRLIEAREAAGWSQGGTPQQPLLKLPRFDGFRIMGTEVCITPTREVQRALDYGFAMINLRTWAEFLTRSETAAGESVRLACRKRGLETMVCGRAQRTRE